MPTSSTALFVPPYFMWLDDPYRFVLWDIFGILILLGIWLLLKKVRLHDKLPISFIIFCISLLPLISIFRPGTYQSGDLSHQAIFTAQFYEILKQHIYIPRWAGQLNFNYGNPMFLFTYPLPYYLGSLFHLMNLSFVDSIKAELIFSYVLSGLFMYSWARKRFSEKGAATAAVFYLFAPYHLINMHFRVALGEMLAIAFLPLILWLIDNYYQTGSLVLLLESSLGVSLLLISHQAVSLITLPFILAYSFFTRQHKFNWLLPFAFGVLLSSWYWFPVLSELKYTHQPFYSRTVEFAPFTNSLFAPWFFGFLYQGHYGETANIIGYIQLVLVAISVFWLLTRRKFIYSWLVKLCLIFIILYFFLEQKISWPVWQYFPFLNNLQFAYRLNALLILLTSVVAAVVYDNIKSGRKNTIFIIIMFAAIFPTILNWGNRKMLPSLTDLVIEKGLPANTLFNPYGPATPVWLNPYDPWVKNFPSYPLEVVTGAAQVTPIFRSDINHTYLINAQTEVKLRENTTYFPGWVVISEGQHLSLDKMTYSTGIIHFNLPPDTYLIEVKFINTADRTIGVVVSLATVLILVLALIFQQLMKSLIKQS